MGAFTMRLKAMVLAGTTIVGEHLVARSISTSPTSRSRRFRSLLEAPPEKFPEWLRLGEHNGAP